MHLAVSNIAWTRHDDPSVFATLRACGVAGIEVAPTKIWPDWEGADPLAAKAYGRRLAAEGFCIPALQAIMFGRPELNIFGEAAVFDALRKHVCFVAELAANLGAYALVFGAPRNRDRGTLQPADAFSRAIDAFRALGEECKKSGVCLCIEANPAAYGCNFITKASDAARLVDEVDSAGFGLHLDAGGMHLEGEDGAAVIRGISTPIRHFHASEPQLGPFDRPCADHPALAGALKDIGYSGWISIEMRATEHERDAVETACAAVTEAYESVLR